MRAATWCLLAAFLATLPGAPPAFAELEGERVISGEATFERDGANTTITTGTRETIVDYDRFDVGVEERVRIDQPDAGSRILNRVPRGDESHIDGQLSSNGIVYILNPAGVFLGDRAIVDVSSLVAGAGALSNEDFLAGVDRFTEVSGDVGIAAGAQVRAAGDVALVGRRVENLGSIVSTGGMIAFVAGERVLLARMGGHIAIEVDTAEPSPGADFALTQAGRLEAQKVTLAAGDAYSLAMNHTGVTRAQEIHVEAQGDGLVQVAGTLDASNAAPGERGGEIRVQGGRIAVEDAVLDASGAAGGGAIRVGGDLRGGGDMPVARQVEVDAESSLRADATAAGDGGTIIVYADERTRFFGDLSARGGPEGGDGGFAEISGSQLVASGAIDLGAPQGKSGTVLFDPDKLVIEGGIGTQTPGPGDPADTSFMTEAFIEGLEANVVIEATNRIETRGDFTNVASGEGDDVVVIMPGNSLTIRTTGTTAPTDVTADNDELLLGIDLTAGGNENLAWRVSQGGNIALETKLATVLDNPATAPKASIKVGALESDGARFHPDTPVDPQDPHYDPTVDIFDPRNVSVSAVRGDIEIGSIEAEGEDASPEQKIGDVVVQRRRVASSGADITISTEQGDIEMTADIQAFGGNAVPDAHSPGGDGATVAIGTSDGNVTLGGDIDVHGGDGLGRIDVVVQGRDAPVGFFSGGGFGGGIDVAALGESNGVVRIEGDLIANGGRGVAVAQTGEDVVEESDGGLGGAIAIAAQRQILVGSAGNHVQLQASGGAGSRLGGNARGGLSVQSGVPAAHIAQAFRFTGPPGAEGQLLSTLEKVEIHADLVAQGGAARSNVFDPTLERTLLLRSAGGRGGDVQMLPSVLEGRDMTIDVSGGKGDFAPVEGTPQPRVASNGLPFTLGGRGGSVVVIASNRSDVGTITSKGGDAVNGVAGIGGLVTLAAGDSAATAPVAGVNDLVVGDIDTSGGNATREFTIDVIDGNYVVVDDGVAVDGALGGGIELDAIEKDVGRVLLRGEIRSDRGTGLDSTGATTHARPNALLGQTAVDVAAQSAIELHPDAVAADVVVSGGAVLLHAPRVGKPGVGQDPAVPVPIAGTALNLPDPFAPDADADFASITASEHIGVEIRTDEGSGGDTDALEAVELVLEQETASARVTRPGAAPGQELVLSTGVPGVNVIQRFATQDSDPLISYRLDKPVVTGEARPDLAIARGAIALGAAGGAITNGGIESDDELVAQNRGAVIDGGGLAPSHGTSQGLLLIEGKALGTSSAPLIFAGDGAVTTDVLVLDAQGDVHASVTSPFEGIGIIQFDPTKNATLDLPGTDAIDIVAEGSATAPVSLIRVADTTVSGSDFIYEVGGPTPAGIEAQLAVDAGAMRLGGAGALSARGDVVLGDGAIATNGNNLALESVAGSIRQSGDVVSIDLGATPGDRRLVLTADQSIGGAGAPIRTRGVEQLAGRAGQGSFVLANDGAGTSGLRIERTTNLDPADFGGAVPESEIEMVPGVSAGSEFSPGNIDIAQTGAPIVLGDITDGFEFSGTHLTASGNVKLTAPQGIELENARVLELDVPVAGPIFLLHNDARIAAGGDVTFDGDVRTSEDAYTPEYDSDDPKDLEVPEDVEGLFVHGSLQIAAGGTARFTGNVGGDGALANASQRLGLLDTTNASVEGADTDTRHFTVGDAHFRGTLDGPARAVIVAEDLIADPDDEHEATVTFEGDLGARQALGGLHVEAEHIRFTSADRLIAGAGGVRLTTNQDKAEPPPRATIADTAGGLGIQTSGDFEIGDYDKLSVLGPLEIEAGGVVRVTDVNAARRLAIEAREIQVVARRGAKLERKDGSTPNDLDTGTDLVADSMDFSVVPVIDDDLAPGAPVRLGLGGGGVSAPGNLSAFEVRRFTPDVEAVNPGDMIGVGGSILDLHATGNVIVGYPSEDMPHERAIEDPALPPQFSESGPGAPPTLDAGQVLAFLRCGEADAGVSACDAADAASLSSLTDWDDSALATPRAEQLAARYRALRSHDLSAAFDAAGAGYRASRGFGEFDAEAFAAYLEQSPEHAEARAAVHELATLLTEVELLGLAPAEEARVRSALAADFAHEAELPDFDSDAVFAAVAATPIGLPPAE